MKVKVLILAGVLAAGLGLVADEGVRRLVLADESRAQLHYWDSSDPAKCYAIPGEKPMWDLKKVGPQRYRVVVKKGYFVYDLEQRKVVETFRHPSLDEVTAICDMPDGGFLACVNPRKTPPTGKAVLLVRFSAAKELVATYRVDGCYYARTLEWDKVGETLLVAWEKGVTRVRLPKTGDVCEKLLEFRQPKGRNSFDCHPTRDGKGYLVGAGYQGGLVHFDLQGKMMAMWEIPQMEGKVTCFYAQVQEMPDGGAYLAHWTGHGANDSVQGWQVVSFDPAGKPRWHLDDPVRFGSISGVDVVEAPELATKK